MTLTADVTTAEPTRTEPVTPGRVDLGPAVRRRPMLIEMTELDARLSIEEALSCVERTHPGMSAQHRLSRGQRIGGVATALLVLVALIVRPVGTLMLAVTSCTLVYLATIAHRVAMVRSALRSDPLISISDADARAIPDADLPLYTVLVPAYGEPQVIPSLIRNLERLEYPRARLEILLLLEEGDTETLHAALATSTDLHIYILALPPGGPQTKPRALNVGLQWSQGELVTVYDAEDRPDPLQLRKAVAALRRLPDTYACLQARLEFYDVERNMLTKWFAAEYLTWFTCFLPGLVERGGVVPLGGTSNHFRRRALAEVGAWDAYNVTEDADLGIRLQRAGYDIGVLDSVTYEEVNSDVINWIKQRSRWQKGYLQTALVHLRHPRRVVADLGWKRFGHLILFVAGTPLLGVINLAFWAVSALWFATQARFIEQLFPGAAYYLALFSWGLGNFIIAYVGVLTVMRTKRWELIGSILLAPAYWVLMSIAALRAIIQFVVAPSHWEKTTHGLAAPPDDRPAEDLIDLRTIDLRPLDLTIG